MLKSTSRSQLSPLERHQVRTLIAQDTIALASVFLITAVLAVATYFLFQSYTTHRRELADRWFSRGQKALNLNQPLVAIQALHSALLYAPGQRQIEITLASALASAGRIAEATAYFNTLRETEPGNGLINLQLARLAARSGNEETAKYHYHAAIYGNWEGDGYMRRRDTRLELARYLISKSHYEQARSELLVAAGNAPSSDLEVQSLIAGLLVEAHAPADALNIYQQLLVQSPSNLAALRGAASTAYSLGIYQLAHQNLVKAVAVAENADHVVEAAANQPANPREEAAKKLASQDLLRKVNRIIILDPSSDLAPAALATRLINDRDIARRRFEACAATQDPAQTLPPAAETGSATPAVPAPSHGLSTLLHPFRKSADDAEPATTTNAGAAEPAGSPMEQLSHTWAAEPPHLTAKQLMDNFALEQQEIKLIQQTELLTQAACGEPTGDDAILLRLAQVPSTHGLEQTHE